MYFGFIVLWSLGFERRSLLTQSLAKRLGYEITSSIDYDSFIDSKGERPFKGLSGKASLALLKLPSYTNLLKDKADLKKSPPEEKYFGNYSIFPTKEKIVHTTHQHKPTFSNHTP